MSERQMKGVAKLFVNAFACGAPDKRKDIYMEFVDTFYGVITPFYETIYSAFVDDNISADIVEQWQIFEKERKAGKVTDGCIICRMSADDESTVAKLLAKELGCMPHLSEFCDIGCVKDFATTGFSFVARKDNEIVGVIMAQKIMDYGSCHIFVNDFAVKKPMQGQGIGRMLMMQVLSAAKEANIHKIKLYTEKTWKAYDIYHHMGFEDQEEESVYLTKWFL